MFRPLRSALLATAFLGFGTGAAFADFELHILHINDFHSRFEAINKYDSTCSSEDEGKGACFGGIARLKAAIDSRRAELKDKAVLTLSAGDEFQGSLFYTNYKSAPIAEMMNGIGFDAIALGNHEFDDGPEELAKFLGALKAPVVSGNTLAGLNTPIADRYKGYVIDEVGGQKVAVIGVLTQETDETSSPGKDVLFGDEIAYLKGAVKEVGDQGVNKIIVLSHVGYERDKEIAAAVDGIDVIVGGHSHTLLANNNDKAAGPYPTMVKDPAGKEVPIVTAGAYSRYLGDLTVVFDDNGEVKSATGEPKLLDQSVKPDAAFAARVAELAKPLDALRNKEVAETSAPIDGSRETCRAKECEMGNLVADAMLDRVKDQGMQIAIENGGGLRASIDQGTITMGEILTVLPFQNTLATFQMKGADVIQALENGVGQVEKGEGRFPQVAGMKYSADLSRPAGSRITAVEVKEGEAFAPLDPAKTYGVVTNNYMRGGGDGYSIFATKAEKAYDYGPNLEDVVAAYLTEHQPYKPYLDGRVTISGSAPAVAEEQAPAASTSTAAPAATAPAETASGTAAPAATAGTEAAAKPQVYVVKKGDTLWDISKTYLGAGADWKRISEANGNPRPRHLAVGKELSIPAK